ncbi:MAG: methionine adenosyltransferase [Candidatus Thermoplasmatota archaeon]|nr:methionine adenosyltransferase [Candidatus Thermoplasmatota archaeon]
MERNIVVESLPQVPVEKREVEIVERKGIGHPDSISDGIAESVSRALSKYYLSHYGRILHHNTDQVEVVGGQSQPSFGGGVVLEPVYILLSGRATTTINGTRIPYRSIATKAAIEFIRSKFNTLDVESDVMVDCRIGHGSVDLRSLYDTRRLLSNDTSFGVGFAPFSETEAAVIETEHFINGELKKTVPALGHDVKVMGFRRGDTINLTIAAAMVDRHLKNEEDYIDKKEKARELILNHVQKSVKRKVNVFINTADSEKDNIYYLTVTGLSMENGDDGSVGRGNRVNGIITPYRPMSMEAAAGKNPVTHVGKLYNLSAWKIAEQCFKESGGAVPEIHVRIVSQIGRPIDDPHVANIQIVGVDETTAKKYMKDFTRIADDWLAHLDRITNMLVNGEIQTF